MSHLSGKLLALQYSIFESSWVSPGIDDGAFAIRFIVATFATLNISENVRHKTRWIF